MWSIYSDCILIKDANEQIAAGHSGTIWAKLLGCSIVALAVSTILLLCTLLLFIRLLGYVCNTEHKPVILFPKISKSNCNS